jgi:hypothetical protein
MWQRLRAVVGRDPAAWNDSVCRSKEEAVAMLRQAAYHK